MGRNASGVYSLPAGSTISNGDTSDASDLNTPLADLELENNGARPIVAGGTGATTAATALANLGGASASTITGAWTFSATATFAGILATSIGGASDSNTTVSFPGSDVITFDTGGSEAFRVAAGQQVIIGKQVIDPTIAGAVLRSSDSHTMTQDGDTVLSLNRETDDGSILDFRTSNTVNGSVSISGSTTSFNTTSDYRLKTDVAPMEGALDALRRLAPSTFTMAGKRLDGFLAHELQDVIPHAVTGVRDGPEMQQVDLSKVVPLLTAALIELAEKVDAK